MNYLYLYIVINGFLSISFEILAIRLFTPFFGAGTEQTSIIIGTVLLFYALGNFYSSGHSNPKKILIRNIFWAAFFHGVVLTNPALQYLYNHFVLRFIPFQYHYMRLPILSLITLGPLAFIYGQNLPILMKVNSLKNVNYILGFGTIGSFLGSVLTAITLVYFLPASWFVLISIGLVFFMALILFPNIKLLGLIPIFILSIYFNLVENKRLVQWETGVANYDMVEEDEFKGFIIDGANYSSIIIGDDKSSPYNEILHKEILDNTEALKVLILGAGGFSLSIKNKHHNYKYVDIDPKIKEVVAKKFNPNPVGDYVHSDARAFLINDKKHYDVIVQDVFSIISMPEHLLTLEHFQKVHQRLTPTGYFAMNITHWGSLLNSTKASRIAKTIKNVFGNCYFIPIGRTPLYQTQRPFMQTLAICQKSALKSKQITDDEY